MIGGQGAFQTKMNLSPSSPENLSPSSPEIESKTILEIATQEKLK